MCQCGLISCLVSKVVTNFLFCGIKKSLKMFLSSHNDCLFDSSPCFVKTQVHAVTSVAISAFSHGRHGASSNTVAWHCRSDKRHRPKEHCSDRPWNQTIEAWSKSWASRIGCFDFWVVGNNNNWRTWSSFCYTSGCQCQFLVPALAADVPWRVDQMVAPKERYIHWWLVQYVCRLSLRRHFACSVVPEHITWGLFLCFRFLGESYPGDTLNQIFSEPSHGQQIGGDFKEWLNITETFHVLGDGPSLNGLYICEVCVFRGMPFEECHLANTSLQVIGGPPIFLMLLLTTVSASHASIM